VEFRNDVGVIGDACVDRGFYLERGGRGLS
jgi:hypothetical protein